MATVNDNISDRDANVESAANAIVERLRREGLSIVDTAQLIALCTASEGMEKALENIEYLCAEAIAARLSGNTRAYSLLIVSKNAARAALSEYRKAVGK
jgi:hypothetical protein